MLFNTSDFRIIPQNTTACILCAAPETWKQASKNFRNAAHTLVTLLTGHVRGQPCLKLLNLAVPLGCLRTCLVQTVTLGIFLLDGLGRKAVGLLMEHEAQCWVKVGDLEVLREAVYFFLFPLKSVHNKKLGSWQNIIQLSLKQWQPSFHPTKYLFAVSNQGENLNM